MIVVNETIPLLSAEHAHPAPVKQALAVKGAHPEPAATASRVFGPASAGGRLLA
jgi:hypothetical protein